MLDSSFHRDAALARPSVAPRILLASAADVPFIVDAIVAGARDGHFSCDCSRPDVLRGLWHQVQAVVSEGRTPLPGARDGAGGRAFVVQAGGVNAGFAMLVEREPGSWRDSVELFAMSVHPTFRGAGLGRHLVTSLVRDAQSAHVYARVAFASTAMNGLLRSCGFTLGARADHGTVTLDYRRPA